MRHMHIHFLTGLIGLIVFAVCVNLLSGCIPENINLKVEGGTDNRVILVSCLDPRSIAESDLCKQSSGIQVDCADPQSELEVAVCNQP